MRVRIGDKVRFTPHFSKDDKFKACDGGGNRVIAGVVYVNRPHSYFIAEWVEQGHTLRECFKFTQIGQVVNWVGRK